MAGSRLCRALWIREWCAKDHAVALMIMFNSSLLVMMRRLRGGIYILFLFSPFSCLGTMRDSVNVNCMHQEHDSKDNIRRCYCTPQMERVSAYSYPLLLVPLAVPTTVGSPHRQSTIQTSQPSSSLPLSDTLHYLIYTPFLPSLSFLAQHLHLLPSSFLFSHMNSPNSVLASTISAIPVISDPLDGMAVSS